MVTTHSGRRGKPVKLQKKGTATTKSHRFEPFSQRVVKLKIDPIHRVRRNDLGDEDTHNTASYFRSSLEHWMELNLSENFAQFSQRVSPLCESLPQVLYHENRIMGLLEEYISKKDELSMESLLSLLSQFSRDLGSRFEKHFASAVTLVASVAATHSSIEVIEWSFTCLAWIFKFLSRLLVPDLRQLLSIMTPYLGKERQKYFVTRFAAESMSFLLRKAALTYYRNKQPLTKALKFLVEDLAQLADSHQAATYQEGLMGMLADSIKGVKGGLYSNGADILDCLMVTVSAQRDASRKLGLEVVGGVLINVIHNTSAETFTPLLDVICKHIDADATDPSSELVDINIRLIFLCVATRKGSRIQEWKKVHQALLTLLQHVESNKTSRPETVQQLLASVVVGIQTSPIDELMPYMRRIMDTVSDKSYSDFFLPFCSLFSASTNERFQSVVFQYFQR